MSLFAIGDLHLSFFRDKPMDKFGDNWKNHAEKLKKNWTDIVSKEDTVIIAGDTSWAMNWEEVAPDMEYLRELPGRKIMISGNHDYWWTSTGRAQALFPWIFFLKNNFTVYEQYAICGTRGWLCPNDSNFTAHDLKLYRREEIRLRFSLESAASNGHKQIITAFHFPPMNDSMEPSVFSDFMDMYGVEKAVYGHLHGEQGFRARIKDVQGQTDYHLVSSDYLDFIPKKII